jgi:hypothetical protein
MAASPSYSPMGLYGLLQERNSFTLQNCAKEHNRFLSQWAAIEPNRSPVTAFGRLFSNSHVRVYTECA